LKRELLEELRRLAGITELTSKLRWQDAGKGKFWARFQTDDTRQYTHKYRIRQRGAGEWIVELETPDGTKFVDAARNPNMAKQLAQQHMEKII
jgi:hypothetical protein